MQMPLLHKRLAAFVGLSLLLLLASGFIPNDPTNNAVELATPLPEQRGEPHKGDVFVANNPAEPARAEQQLLVAVEKKVVEKKEIVQDGDSMALIFARNDFSARSLYTLTQTKHGDTLNGIFPGAELTFDSDQGKLTKLTYQPSPLERVVFSRDKDGGFTSEEIIERPEKILTYKHGVIDSSLFLTSQAIGLPDNVTMRLAQIFQWDVDFVLDIRPGDEFFALVEEQYLDGEFIGFGNIVSARFINQGRTYTAVRYTTQDGVSDYFDAQGLSMRKAFLRAPVEFSRISSSFNLRRKHECCIKYDYRSRF